MDNRIIGALLAVFGVVALLSGVADNLYILIIAILLLFVGGVVVGNG